MFGCLPLAAPIGLPSVGPNVFWLCLRGGGSKGGGGWTLLFAGGGGGGNGLGPCGAVQGIGRRRPLSCGLGPRLVQAVDKGVLSAKSTTQTPVDAQLATGMQQSTNSTRHSIIGRCPVTDDNGWGRHSGAQLPQLTDKFQPLTAHSSCPTDSWLNLSVFDAAGVGRWGRGPAAQREWGVRHEAMALVCLP